MAEPQRLDDEHPWPGLTAFGEADRAYFRGRTREADELARLVRRERLTLLFGRSGLGKSSLLNAGLLPGLREDLHLPVMLRIGYDAEISPREQVWQALAKACSAAGITATPPEHDETLWAYFHRAGAGFWNLRRRPMLPVLVFDQFEELFTRGQASAAARAAAEAFIDELADLVEDRPSQALRQRLDADPRLGERIDFERRGCKLLLSFREDFLAQVEGLRVRMPALMRNRFRLLPMSGEQARAVIGSGGALVDAAVGERIIGLAWRNLARAPSPEESARIEVDPALLSVICSELNLRRRDAGAAMIESDLLTHAEREILASFYERSMSGLGPGVRHFVEDKLITVAGHRNSFPYDDALTLEGVSADALQSLVAGRLLRLDDRFGVRQLELTHDVLNRVVMASRDQRRAREAEVAALAREQAARARQARNRRNARRLAAGAALVLVLAGVALWQYLQTQHMLVSARSGMLGVTADELQDSSYDVALLVNLEALHLSATPSAAAGLLRRFNSHPHLQTYLTGHQQRAYSVAFSPDGRWVASAGKGAEGDKSGKGGEVILSDARTGVMQRRLTGQVDAVFGIAFSPDSRRLVSAGKDGNVVVWALPDGTPELIGNLASGPSKQAAIQAMSVAYSPDGQRLAASGQDGSVVLWEGEGPGRSRRTLVDGRREGVAWSVAFSPDGRQLASAHQTGQLLLWSLTGDAPPRRLPGGNGELRSVAFSPDGLRLAAASTDRTITLWDLANPTRKTVLKGHRDEVLGLAFSPDSRQLASASLDTRVLVWDLASAAAKPDQGEAQPLLALSGHHDGVFGVAFSPDGLQLVSTGEDKRVIVWNLAQTQLLDRIDRSAQPLTRVAFSPNGLQLASASATGQIALWAADGTAPSVVLDAGGPDQDVSSLVFSPDGQRLAAAGKDGKVVLWDVAGRRQVRSLRLPGGFGTGVAFAAADQRLAVSSSSGKVYLWNLEAPPTQPPVTLAGHDDWATSVAFSADGQRLASGSLDYDVILWDLPRQQVQAKLSGHIFGVNSVAFSPDGRRLASAADDDRSVLLWDVTTGQRVTTIGPHDLGVTQVAYSPDGQRLASAVKNKTVVLWDAASGRRQVVLSGPAGKITGLAFSPDGRRLAASHAQGLAVWRLPDTASLSALACRVVHRNLSCEEWRAYIGNDLPYRITCPGLPGPSESCR